MAVKKFINYNSLTCMIVFLFPLFSGVMNHWGSAFFFLFLGLSLLQESFSIKSLFQFELLNPMEKIVWTGFFIFFFGACLSLILTASIEEGIKRLEKLEYLLFLIPVYHTCRKHQVDCSGYLLKGLIIAGPIMACVAAYQTLLQGIPRATGGYNELVFGASAMVKTLICTAALCTLPMGLKKRSALVIAALCAFYASIASGTRGAWLCFPFVLMVQIVLMRKPIKVRIWTALSIIIVVMLVTASPYTGSRLIRERITYTISSLKQFKHGENKYTSMGWRFLMWENSLKIWRANPVFGTGIGDFRHDTKELINEGKTEMTDTWKHAHSIYFEFLATTGMAGLITMFLSIFVFPFMAFWKNYKENPSRRSEFLSVSGISVLIFYSIMGLTWNWFTRSPHVITYAMCIIIFMVPAANLPEDTKY